MAKGLKTGGGSRKGIPNKLTTDVQAFVDRIFSNIDPVEKLTALLSSESEKVQAGVILRLLEYRYGKPKESLELSGSIEHKEILMRVRARHEANESKS